MGSRQNDFSDSGRESNCSTTRIGPEANSQALQAMLSRQAEIKVTQFRFPVRFNDHSLKSILLNFLTYYRKSSISQHNPPPPPMYAPSLRIRSSFIKGPLTIYALSLRPSKSAYASSLFETPTLNTPPHFIRPFHRSLNTHTPP